MLLVARGTTLVLVKDAGECHGGQANVSLDPMFRGQGFPLPEPNVSIDPRCQARAPVISCLLHAGFEGEAS